MAQIGIAQSGITSKTTGSSGGGLAGVNQKTGNYALLSGDNGKLVTFAISGAATATLPSPPPSSTWAAFIQNTGTANLTVSPNGLTLDGSSASLIVNPGQGILVFTDGTNYFSERGIAGGLLAAVDLTGQLAAIGSTNFANTGTGLNANMYTVFGFVDVTTAATSGNLTVTISYTTDSGADSQTTANINLGSLGSNGGFVITFFASANSAISYSTSFVSVVGSPAYSLHMRLVAAPGTVTSGSGGGAPTTSEYLLGTPDTADLPNSVANPTAYFGPNAQPNSAGSLDDEFPGSSLSGSWTQANIGSTTLAVSNSCLKWLIPASTSGNIATITKSAPSTPWTVIAKTSVTEFPLTSNQLGGIVLADGTGKLIVFRVGSDSTNPAIYVQRFTSASVFNATTKFQPNMYGINQLCFLQIQDNGTNLIYSFSVDGVSYIQFLSESRTAFLSSGPTLVGLHVGPSSATNDWVMDVDFFRRTQ